LQTTIYSAFDENGLPSHDVKGHELSKEVINKLKKEFKKHDEKHKKWLEKNKSEQDK
jgi:cysteinyl-tRNA synthetase